MTVTAAAPEPSAAIAALPEEIDRHYGTPGIEPLDVRTRQIRHALFADPPSAYALLAGDGHQLVGLAAYSFQWPAIGSTRSLYLKELDGLLQRIGTRACLGSAVTDAIRPSTPNPPIVPVCDIRTGLTVPTVRNSSS